MRKLRSLSNKPWVVILAAVPLVFLLFATLRANGKLELLELAAFDAFIRMSPKTALANQRITIIEITEEDIQSIGSWPLSDKMLADALRTLLAHGPRAVGVDIFRDIPVPPGREELENLFGEHPSLIGVMTIGDKGIGPLPSIKGTVQAAFGDILVDPGGTVRRGLLFLDDGHNAYTSFALTLALLYLEQESIHPQADPANPDNLLLNQASIRPLEAHDGGYRNADSRGYQFLLDFRDSGHPFRAYRFTELLAGVVPPDAINDRIVLIGVRSYSVHDSFYTPLSRGREEHQQMHGVVLHAHIASQLLRFALENESPVSTMPEPLRSAWLLLWTLIGGAAVYRVRSASRFTLVAVVGLAVLTAAAYASFLFRTWIPLVPPALSFLVAATVVTAYMTGQEKKTRTMLMQIFSSHVSSEIATMIWDQKDKFLEHGRPRSQEMIATILFSDLKGFTSQSEKMDPRELIDWLNVYMESMASVIMDHGGVIDNYIGDAIMADFGVPLPRTGEEEIAKDAVSAVECALAMEKELHRLNKEWRLKGTPTMGMRIGIHTGPIVAGLLGSAKRLKYTALGDTVNTASRLESLDKSIAVDAACRILVSGQTKALLGTLFETEQVGEMPLKGKEGRIVVHRVIKAA
jgi:adenylate cyclase